MSQKSFADKLTTFFLGEPVPVLSEHDLETIHKLDGKLDELLTVIKARPAPSAQLDLEQQPPLETGAPAAAEDQPADGDLTEQLRKLAKTQFKANTLQEKQLAQQEETLARLQKAIDRQEDQLTKLMQQRQQAVEAALDELIKKLLPVLDGLDAAFDSGRGQVLNQAMPAETRRAVIAWLDGVRLARMRLLDLLKAYNVTPIPTLGQAFDPHRHVAVATKTTDQAPDGTIIGEDRRGYATPGKVLRFAEVVVARLKRS